MARLRSVERLQRRPRVARDGGHRFGLVKRDEAPVRPTFSLKSAAAKQFFEGTGSEAWTTSGVELAKFQAAETQKWGKVIKAAGIEPE